MRTIVAGSRDFDDYRLLKATLDALPWEPCIIVSGTARGADSLGEFYAKDMEIMLKQFPADWYKHGKSAGYIRNTEMASYAEALVAFWDGESKGTKHMIDIAIDKGLYVKVVRV